MQKFNAGKMSKGTKLPENPFCCPRPCSCLFAVVVVVACSVRSKLGNYLSLAGIFLVFFVGGCLPAQFMQIKLQYFMFVLFLCVTEAAPHNFVSFALQNY